MNSAAQQRTQPQPPQREHPEKDSVAQARLPVTNRLTPAITFPVSGYNKPVAAASKKPPASELALPPEPYVGAKEAAAFLGIPELSCKRYASRGIIPSHLRPGGNPKKPVRMYLYSELKRYMENKDNCPSGPI